LCKWTALETHHITYFENSWKIVEQTSMHIEKSVNNYKIREPLTSKTFSEPTNQTLNIIENSLQEYVNFSLFIFVNNAWTKIKNKSIKEAVSKHPKLCWNISHQHTTKTTHFQIPINTLRVLAELQSARWFSSGGDCQEKVWCVQGGRQSARWDSSGGRPSVRSQLDDVAEECSPETSRMISSRMAVSQMTVIWRTAVRYVTPIYRTGRPLFRKWRSADVKSLQ
jgi:hypothetical protein